MRKFSSSWNSTVDNIEKKVNRERRCQKHTHPEMKL